MLVFRGVLDYKGRFLASCGWESSARHIFCAIQDDFTTTLGSGMELQITVAEPRHNLLFVWSVLKPSMSLFSFVLLWFCSSRNPKHLSFYLLKEDELKQTKIESKRPGFKSSWLMFLACLIEAFQENATGVLNSHCYPVIGDGRQPINIH